jgi:hypothetical protein
MLSKEDLLEHLASEHGVDAPSSKPETRHTRAKKTASVLGDDAAENSTKKAKIRKPSNKKGAPSSSETTKPNTKSPAHKSTIRIKYESEDEDDEESVGLPAGRTGRKSTRRIVGSEDDDDDESVGLSLGGIGRTVLEDKPTKTKSSKRAKSTTSKSIGP